jgi:hypothetical protein
MQKEHEMKISMEKMKHRFYLRNFKCDCATINWDVFSFFQICLENRLIVS